MPPIVLGPSVLDKGVGTTPIVTYLGPTYAQTMSYLLNFGHMPMTSGAAMGKLWQTDVIKITKEIRLLLKQNK